MEFAVFGTTYYAETAQYIDQAGEVVRVFKELYYIHIHVYNYISDQPNQPGHTVELG